jgi:purine-cytosine permease-like protein
LDRCPLLACRQHLAWLWFLARFFLTMPALGLLPTCLGLLQQC